VIISCQQRESLEPIALHNDYIDSAGWVLMCVAQASEHGGHASYLTTGFRRSSAGRGKGCRLEVLRTMSAISLAASVALGGCTSSPKPDEGQKAAGTTTVPEKKVAAVSARAHSKSDTSKNATSAVRLDQLIGLDEASLRSLLGQPAATEEAAPSKLWIYRRRQCTMNITLYPDVETRKFYALNYEVSGNDGSTRQQQCITQFSSQLAALNPPG
jgi:hypothetical protein